MNKNGMSIDMYNYIRENLHRFKIDTEKGIITTAKGSNGALCTSTGYLRVKAGKRALQVHQILAVVYFGENCIGMQVNHKDGVKINNTRENLEAITQKENLKHQKDFGLLGKPNPTNSIKVDMLDMSGNYIKTYESIMQASRELGISDNGIRYAIKGFKGDVAYTQSGGYKWRTSTE